MSKLAARGGLKHHWSNPSRFKSECAYSLLSFRVGSTPALSFARVAQLAAHLICNQAAVGSNPTASLAYIAIQFVQEIQYPSVIVGIYISNYPVGKPFHFCGGQHNGSGYRSNRDLAQWQSLVYCSGLENHRRETVRKFKSSLCR